jgi:ribose/xylose/arabinose/galactoside ABC-type transport system permease subunit
MLTLVLLAGALVLAYCQSSRPEFVLELWRPWAQIGILAVAMTAIMLTGGIDLSVGSMVALSGVVLSVCWRRLDWSIETACVFGVLAGTLAGAINGALVVAGVAPLIATLATMAFHAGMAMALVRGERISGLPDAFTWYGQGRIGGLPTQFFLFAVAVLAGWVVVHHTRFGRCLFAMGENRDAAQFAAVPVRRIDWWLYTTSGFCAGVVGLIYAAHQAAVAPNAGVGFELQAIACVVLGGTPVTGGAGGIGRTLLGILTLAHLDIGLQFLERIELPGTGLVWEFRDQHRQICIGLLVIAVAVWNQRFREQADTSPPRCDSRPGREKTLA